MASTHRSQLKNRFRYSPLAAGGAIRLLRILPANPDDELVCILFQVNPKFKDEYPWTAVSYAWSDPNPNRNIRVNGRPFLTTVSCHEALLSLRQLRPPVVVWIDAVCIDQNNDYEKGHQVQRMSFIYHEEVCISVWLGHPSTD